MKYLEIRKSHKNFTVEEENIVVFQTDRNETVDMISWGQASGTKICHSQDNLLEASCWTHH